MSLTHYFAGDEPMDHFNLEEDIADLELAVDGDDEEELFDDAEIPEEVCDSKSTRHPS
jgi:hypothetical protein